MKKTTTFLGLFTTLVVSLLFIVACGRLPSTMTQEQISEELRYRPYTPANEIVEGKNTAIQTINEYLKKKVIVGNDDHEACTESNPAFDGDNVYLKYEVNNFNSNYRILYLYKDDTHIVEAVPTNETYISGDSINTLFKNVSSYNGEVGSWTNAGKAVAVLNKDAGYRCSSIWGYDQATNEVKLIFCDSFDCPIWVNYYNA